MRWIPGLLRGTRVHWRLAVVALAVFSVVGMSLAQTTIRWGMLRGGHTDPVLEYFIPKYEEETGVRVEVDVLPSGEFTDRMLIELVGQTGRYDIIYHSGGWFGLYYQYMADLTPYMEKYEWDIDRFVPKLVEAHMTHGTRPGEVIAIPHVPQNPLLAYRKDWLEHPEERAAFQAQYGRELSAPQTWEELYEVATFFTRPGGSTVAGQVVNQDVYGWETALRHPAATGRLMVPFTYSLGLKGFDEDFEPDIDSPILVEGAELLLNLIQDAAPPAAVNWDYLEGLEYMRQGRLFSTNLWIDVGSLEAPGAASAGNLGYQPLPRWAEGMDTRGYVGGGGLNVIAGPNEEEAFKFLKWLLDDQADEYARRTGFFIYTDQFEDQELLDSQPYFRDYLPAFLEGISVGFVRQGIPEYSAAMWNTAAEFLNEIMSGVAIEEAQENWVSRMRREFERAGYY